MMIALKTPDSKANFLSGLRTKTSVNIIAASVYKQMIWVSLKCVSNIFDVFVYWYLYIQMQDNIYGVQTSINYFYMYIIYNITNINA